MFKHFKGAYLDKLLDDARVSPELDADVYTPIYEFINTFVTKNKLVVSSEKSETRKVFKIYGAYIFKHANALANALTKFTPFVRLNTNVKNKEFSIAVDGDYMVNLYNIDPVFMNIMRPVVSGIALPTLSPEVELIDVYHKLYSPNMADSWTTIVDRERVLWKSFAATKTSIINDAPVKGGGEHTGVVLDWLKDQSGYVLVGDAAVKMLKGREPTGVTQIIVADPQHFLKSLMDHMRTFIGNSVRSKRYDLNLPNDFRARKYVVMATIDDRTYYIANVFNSAEFELIPYTKRSGYALGTPTVQLRFLFVDLWFTRVLYYFKMMEKGRYVSNVKRIYSNVDMMHSLFRHTKINSYPLYIGTYIDESVGKKKGQVIYPYYPAKYKIDTGKFRSV